MLRILYFKKQIYIFLTITVIIYIFLVPFCLIILNEGGPGLFILFLGTVGWLALGGIILLLVFCRKVGNYGSRVSY